MIERYQESKRQRVKIPEESGELFLDWIERKIGPQHLEPTFIGSRFA